MTAAEQWVYQEWLIVLGGLLFGVLAWIAIIAFGSRR